MWNKPQTWERRDRILVKQTALTCLYLLILFLGIMSYFYGSLFRSDEKAHNLDILAIDYDGSEIGSALRSAYNSLEGSDFLTLHFQPASAYPDINNLGQSAICSQRYWGVIYTHPGATERLRAAITGNTNTSTPSQYEYQYNSSDTITIIYNGIHYPVISEAFIEAKLATLAATTTTVFHAVNGASLFQATNSTNPPSISALLDPIRPTTIVLSPATQGTRVLLNTITMVAPPLMQFFFVMALDHISPALNLYTRHPPSKIYFTRLIGSNVFSLIGAATITLLIFLFRESWALSGAQVAQTWAVFSFYMSISYLVMDSLIGTVVPMRYAPFCIFTWVILNVTSTLYPFEMSPGFYRWGYALPAHGTWLLLMRVWSRGCVERLSVALPGLFAWWVVGHGLSAVAVWRKCVAGREGVGQHGQADGRVSGDGDAKGPGVESVERKGSEDTGSEEKTVSDQAGQEGGKE